MKYYKIIISAVLLIGILMGIFTLFNKETQKSPVSGKLLEEVKNRPLQLSGKIPNWLNGTLIRNGPINVTINGKTNAHWFDGLAMLHAFSFSGEKVSYTNQFLRSKAYHTVFDQGSLNYDGFAADPCRSLFKNFFTFFINKSGPEIHNANVNVAKFGDQFVALTEVPLPVKFDKKTLDTLGVLDYQDELPKDKCWESAHPHYDFEQKRTTNYLIKFGRKCYYTLYDLEDRSLNRKIIAEVPVNEPAYMHSFAVTENYIILTEFPFVVKPLDLILKNQPFIKNFNWEPQRGTRFIVVSKKDGSLVGTYVTKPFFAFHQANAFEKEGRIYIDVVTYSDADVIKGESLYLNSKKIPKTEPVSQLERFSLSLKTGEITSDILFNKPNEFPRINELHDGKPYQYVYLTGFDEKEEENKELTTALLYKINTLTKTVLEWSEKGCSAGEPVFVSAPNAKEEDDGVVLAVILDYLQNDSFLLILDGKTFKEIGRARAPHLIPAGFHGQYFE